jgi:uncharacterized RmlC-like cupin family protein
VPGCTVVRDGGSYSGIQGLDYNGGDVPVEAVIARTDPNEQESVLPLPELDRLAHLPPL